VVAVVLGLVLLAYYAVALAGLAAVGDLGTLLSAVTGPRALRAATTSLVTATASTLLATVLGLPLSYWLAHTRSRWRAPVTALVVLPLVLPPVVSGMLLVGVLGPGGFLGGLGLTRSLPGVVLAQTFVASPFLVVTATAAFRRVGTGLEEAARTLGETRLGTVRRVSLPLARAGIAAGVTLTFARAIGEFGATLMVAYYPRTLPVQIWASFVADGLDVAFGLAALLLALSVVVLVVVTRLGATPWR
jgi:molybdate/tungstate transport system permease protein